MENIRIDLKKLESVIQYRHLDHSTISNHLKIDLDFILKSGKANTDYLSRIGDLLNIDPSFFTMDLSLKRYLMVIQVDFFLTEEEISDYEEPHSVQLFLPAQYGPGDVETYDLEMMPSFTNQFRQGQYIFVKKTETEPEEGGFYLTEYEDHTCISQYLDHTYYNDYGQFSSDQRFKRIIGYSATLEEILLEKIHEIKTEDPDTSDYGSL